MQTINRKHCVLFAVVVLSVIACFTVRDSALAQNSDSAKSKLISLREERRDVLKTRVEILENLIKNGRHKPEELFAARNDLLGAEYDLATNSDQRINVLQQKVENAKELEAIMVSRKLRALGTEVEVLIAKAQRLAVEIELVKEQEAR